MVGRDTSRPQRLHKSSNAAQLTFLDDPLMRFFRALYSILIIVAFGRQKLRHLVDAAPATPAKRSRGEIYRLADLEFMVLHRALRTVHFIARMHC